MSTILASRLSDIPKQLRIITALDAAEHVGMRPLPAALLHTVAYFADVLAPVWDLPILDGQILKRTQPYYPLLQADVDHLVGMGVVVVDGLDIDTETWPVPAQYGLNHKFADPILEAAKQFENRAEDIAFVREVVFATSGLGLEAIESAPSVDATYGDSLVEIGGLIEVAPREGHNPTSEAALRFRQLVDRGQDLSDAEVVNLYVRHLYLRLHVA